MRFQDAIRDFCRKEGLLAPGDRVICALSGGADSVALLWAMLLLKDPMGLEVSAAHFNHGLRGEESDRDEAFVRQLCDRWEVPLTVGHGTVTRQGRGLEDAARAARYAFFDTLDPDARLATAHTADDNAETVLLRLLRGAGLRGLSGIRPSRGRIIRPMLTVTRADVEEFLEEWSLRHIEDSSNAGKVFQRNRVRQELMPVLRRENPRFSVNVSRMARNLGEDASFLEEMARKAYDRACTDGKLDCEATLSLHPAMRSRVLRQFMQDCGVPEPEAVQLDCAEQLLRSENPSARAVSSGVTLERCYGTLQLHREREELPETELTVPGETRLPGWIIRCTVTQAPETLQKEALGFYLPLEDLGKLTVRGRKPSDRFAGTGGHKSLRKLMIDCHIPAARRDSLPLILEDGEIRFVPGIGPCANRKPKPGAAALRITLEHPAER